VQTLRQAKPVGAEVCMTANLIIN